jgi:hypothetical protein
MKEIRDFLPYYIGQECIYTDKAALPGEKFILTMGNLLWAVNSADQFHLSTRKLNSMTEEEAVEFIHRKHASILCNIDRTEITKVSFGETKNIINFSYFKRRGSSAEAGSKTYYVNQSDPEQFHYLLSRGFDLFQLIDNNLAIEKKEN